MEMKLSQLQMISGQREVAVEVNYMEVQIQFTQIAISISLHLDRTRFKIRRFLAPHSIEGVWGEVPEARQLKLVVQMNENDPKKIENRRQLPMGEMPAPRLCLS